MRQYSSVQVNYLKDQIKNTRRGLPTWQYRQPDRQDSPQSSPPGVNDDEGNGDDDYNSDNADDNDDDNYDDNDDGHDDENDGENDNHLSVSAGQARGEAVEAALLDGRTARHQSHAVGQRELLQNK